MPAQMQIQCSKCTRTKAEGNFYTYKNGQRAEMCKDCMTMHINVFEPETFLWLLEKFDVPYLPGEWNILRDRQYAKDPHKMHSVFGKYLSKMKLKQWNKYGWADTERLQEEAKLKGQQQNQIDEETKKNIRESYERGEISEAQYKTYITTAPTSSATTGMNVAVDPYGRINSSMMPNTYGNNFGVAIAQEMIDVGADLTDEDKTYLSLKWGVTYTPADWISLEQLYKEFTDSFDIQGAARMDTLKMICKTSLKMNQAIDCGDIDSYQKLSRVYDALMKSAKFTEAQRKEEKTGEFDSVGQIVQFAESKKGGGKIARPKIEYAQDIIDETIDKLKRYYVDLIKNDTSLGQEIENFIRKRDQLDEQKKDLRKAREMGYDDVQLTNEDFEKYYEDIEVQKRLDAEEGE